MVYLGESIEPMNTLQEFLDPTAILQKESARFAQFVALEHVTNEMILEVLKEVEQKMYSTYGIHKDTLALAFGVHPLLFKTMQEVKHPKVFTSNKALKKYVLKNAKEVRDTMEALGFRYESHADLHKAFKERQTLLKTYSTVFIAPSYLPKGDSVYIPNLVSLWVKK